ncbi:hypothetical protein BDZ94DRAFT_1274336 [Collybia nuda]|uniref:Uncharacterized protein n=1 Tax=Collybia nuda TaxID=64659 RepID=A0A9P6C957_9AGAR|nr:hypothetical protein BDZ94DRAFT_1274336 [Collybia nuda]
MGREEEKDRLCGFWEVRFLIFVSSSLSMVLVIPALTTLLRHRSFMKRLTVLQYFDYMNVYQVSLAVRNFR